MNHTSDRIWQLEALRGLLCWWVVADHIRIHMPDSFPHIFKQVIWGGHAVNVFVILSGFVISLLLSRYKGWTSFIIRRFFRLWPVFFACLILSLVTWEPGDLAHRSACILSNLSLLHGVIPEAVLPRVNAILPPSWSISLEWQFYIFAPFLVGALASRKFWPVAILVIFMIVSRFSGLESCFVYPAFLPLKLHYFAVGILSFFLWRSLAKVPNLVPLNLAITSIILVGAFTKSISLTIWVATFVAIMPGRINDLLQKHKDLKAFRFSCWLGSISYPTYLVHWPIQVWFFMPPVQEKLRIFANPYVTIFHYFIILFLPLVAASWLLHRGIEIPGNRFGSWISRKFEKQNYFPAS